MKKKILFITKDSILKKLLEKNEDPGGRLESLLGYNCLDPEKYEKNFVNLPRGEAKGLIGRICRLLEKPFMKITRTGIALEAYPLFKKEIKAADIIIGVNDGVGLGLLFWKKLGFVKAEIIVMMMGLPERIKYFERLPLLRRLLAALLKKAAVVTALSDCAGEKLKNYFRLEPGRVKTFHYGANVDYWRPMPEINKGNFIFSIGNDSNRDYQTLIAALPENPPLLSKEGSGGGLTLKIITKIPTIANNPEVEVISDFLAGEELIKLYNKALFAVIPSVKVETESPGLSSALQIMSCGTAVIIPRLPALEELFTDGEDCLFYEPENADDLRKKINLLLNDKALRDKIAAGGRKKVLENYTCQKMAEQLENLLN